MQLLIGFTLIFAVSANSFADELHLVMNGKAIHLDKGEYNEENWGFGVEYDFAPKQDWGKFINVSYFKDSLNNTSKYAGAGLKRRYHLGSSQDGSFVEYGAIAFLMTRKDYNDNRPFPGILPFAALGYGPVTMNVTYIPRVSPKHRQLLFFQVMIRLATFD